jgi:hypothetical protein
MDINTYEAERVERSKDQGSIPFRRHVLSHTTRVAILLEIGEVSRTEILEAQTDAYAIKCQRLETMDLIGGVQNCKFVGPVERLTMVKESATRNNPPFTTL